MQTMSQLVDWGNSLVVQAL